MLRKLLFLVVGLPLGILLVVLSVANRAPVTLILDPFAASPADAAYSWPVPLYLVVLATLLLGVIIGGLVSWWTAGRWRGAARRARAQASLLQVEVNRLRSAAGEAAPPPALPRPRRSAA